MWQLTVSTPNKYLISHSLTHALIAICFKTNELLLLLLPLSPQRLNQIFMLDGKAFNTLLLSEKSVMQLIVVVKRGKSCKIMKLIGIMHSPPLLWHQYDKVLSMEWKILDSPKNSEDKQLHYLSSIRVPSRWHFSLMRQMIWIIGRAACNVYTLGHGWGLYQISGPVAVVFIPPGCTCSSAKRAPEPPGPIQSATAGTWNSFMMTHNEENLPTGELSPSQREKQVSICQITSFRSALGHWGK